MGGWACYYPLARTVMGGLISSAVPTLVVLPYINEGGGERRRFDYSKARPSPYVARLQGQAVAVVFDPEVAAIPPSTLTGGTTTRPPNLWSNRMIGDQQPSAPKRYTFTDYKPYTKDSPLLESGLLGPVTLSAVRP